MTSMNQSGFERVGKVDVAICIVDAGSQLKFSLLALPISYLQL